MKLGDKPWFCHPWGRILWGVWQLASITLCLVSLRFFLIHNPIFYFCITISILQIIVCSLWCILLSAAQNWKPSWMRRVERILRFTLVLWTSLCTILNLVILLYWHWNPLYDPDRNLMIISIFATLVQAPMVVHYLIYPQPLVTVKLGLMSRVNSQPHFHATPTDDVETNNETLTITELPSIEEAQTEGDNENNAGQTADVHEPSTSAITQSSVSIAIQAEIQVPCPDIFPTAPPESPPYSPSPPPPPSSSPPPPPPPLAASSSSNRSSQTSINRPNFPPPPPPFQPDERPTAVVQPVSPGSSNSPLPFGASRPGQCTVCMDRPVDRITDCSHRFCWLCIEHLRSTDMSFKCPVCRNRIRKVRELRLRMGETVDDWPRTITYSY